MCVLGFLCLRPFARDHRPCKYRRGICAVRNHRGRRKRVEVREKDRKGYVNNFEKDKNNR